MDKKDLFSKLQDVVESLIQDDEMTLFYHIDQYSFTKDEDGYTIKYTIPGAEKDKMRLDVEGELIKLTVEKTDTFMGLHDKLWIPDNVSLEGVTASYKDGILLIKMPFLPEGRDLTRITIK